jgi:hypothetical protein
MAEQKNPSPNQNELPQPLLDLIAKLNSRQREFLKHFINAQDPGFGNATKSAELSDYAGEPGSVQLSVQGHRLLNNPKIQRCMALVFEQAGCTLELDAKVIFEAMTATRTRYLRGPDNTIISTPPEPDHPTRLRGVEVKHRLLRTHSATVTYQRLPAAESVAATSAEHGLCSRCGEATDKVAAVEPADRGLLRAITNCDQQLANSDAPQQRPGDEDGNSPAGENSC